MPKIMIDPGHGGRDPGAIGPSGVQEKIVALTVAKQVASILAVVADVRLTRDKDIALGANQNADLAARASMANEWGADIFVSIHCNAVENKAAHGCEVYTSPGKTAADALAVYIIKSMETALPELAFRKDFADGDSDKEATFKVLMETKMPACLVELAFISNPTEEGLLETPSFRRLAAQSIAEGVAGYLGLQLPADAVTISIRGQVLITGKMIDGLAWAPVRDLAEALGKKVGWDVKTKTVTIE